uniref:Uncharacterized protein n=1 Tax=Aegilops tauschii subsp. strangulata TaxID=200361 RepID=A0A453F106_AEGTS
KETSGRPLAAESLTFLTRGARRGDDRRRRAAGGTHLAPREGDIAASVLPKEGDRGDSATSDLVSSQRLAASARSSGLRLSSESIKRALQHPPIQARVPDLITCKEILKIQKFRRLASYAGFYSFTTLVTYAYTSNTTRAGISRADQYYASYPSGTELLTDTAKLYKAALGNCFEIDDWGPIEFSIMAKHFDRQGKPPYAYHAQYMSHLLSHGQLDGSG